MTGLVIFSDENQDTGLAVAVYAAMEKRGWQSNDNMSLAFNKEFSGNDTNAIKKTIEREIDEVMFEAEWSKVKYIYSISEEKPVDGQSA
jgi:hypothetical protein